MHLTTINPRGHVIAEIAITSAATAPPRSRALMTLFVKVVLSGIRRTSEV